MSEVKYPDVKVQLVGRDGNAFVILGAVRRALKSHGVKQQEIEAFSDEATSGNYDQLLATCARWVSVY